MLFLHYGLKSFFARIRANLVTMLAVALFIGGGTLGVTFYINLHKQVVDTAPTDRVLVLAKGASSEAGSKLDLAKVREIALYDGIKMNGTTPLVAREALAGIQVNAGNSYGGATIRGYDDTSFEIHGAKLVEGTLPKPGTLEMLVGRRLQKRFPHLKIGYEIALMGGKAVISGVFSSDGSPYEDELWTPKATLAVLVRHDDVNAMTIVAKDDAGVRSIMDKINSDKAGGAQAQQLSVLRSKSAGVASILKVVLFLLILLSVVATSAIATTMSAAVATRMPEFGTLIAIGLDRRMLSRVVILESVLLSLLGAVFGVLICEVLRRALGTVPLGAVPVEMRAASVVIPIGAGLAMFVGLVGGIAPAAAVSRLDIVGMMR